MAIKVGIIGYGTIGKRVADAVRLQKDMKLIGVTGHSYNFRMEVANIEKIKVFHMDGKEDFENNGIRVAGDANDLIEEVDVVVDCTPKKIGTEHKEKYYVPKKVKAVFQGGEKHKTAGTSFVAQCNYKEALNKDYVRVVSCNTTGLCRTLNSVDKKYGVESVHATMVRRGADPGDIFHGPINAIVPVLEMPSHHGPDVQTVLKNMEIFTTAMSVSTTIMHVHSVIADLKKHAETQDIINLWKDATRVRIVRNAEKVRSTAEIMELARDLGTKRGDMPEICIWEEAVGVSDKKLFYLQAIHQESDVIPENIDCIRAMMGFKDGKKSIEMTNKSFGIK